MTSGAVVAPTAAPVLKEPKTPVTENEVSRKSDAAKKQNIGQEAASSTGQEPIKTVSRESP